MSVTLRVAAALARRPIATAKEIAADISVHEAHVSPSLKQLVHVGAVEFAGKIMGGRAVAHVWRARKAVRA